MEHPINTSSRFSEKEREYHAYQARQNFLWEQRTIQYELDQAYKAKLEAEKREQIAVDREQTALDLAKQKDVEMEQLKTQKDLEIERLKALLAKNNLNS